MDDEFLTVEQAAALLGYNPHSLPLLIKRGDLPARRIGRRVWLIKRSDVEAFVPRGPGRPRKPADA